MRKNFNFVLVGLIAFALIALLRLVREGNGNNATKSDLETVRLELKAQIDSVLRNQDSIKAELRAVRKNNPFVFCSHLNIKKYKKEEK